MKKCRKCGEMKSLDSFHIDNSRKDGRVNLCVDCCKIRDAEYYSRKMQDPEHRRKINKRNREYFKNNFRYREWKKEYKQKWDKDQQSAWKRWFVEIDYGYCIACGAPDPEFHHMIPEEKESTISDLTNRKAFNDENKEIVLVELEKTEPLCNSCHKEIHRRTMALYGPSVLEEMIQERAR